MTVKVLYSWGKKTVNQVLDWLHMTYVLSTSQTSVLVSPLSFLLFVPIVSVRDDIFTTWICFFILSFFTRICVFKNKSCMVTSTTFQICFEMENFKTHVFTFQKVCFWIRISESMCFDTTFCTRSVGGGHLPWNLSKILEGEGQGKYVTFSTMMHKEPGESLDMTSHHVPLRQMIDEVTEVTL